MEGLLVSGTIRDYLPDTADYPGTARLETLRYISVILGSLRRRIAIGMHRDTSVNRGAMLDL
jgi:hypothetical protein